MPYADPEKKRAYDVAYHVAHKARINARSAAWRAANPERNAAMKAAWYIANRDYCLAKSARYQETLAGMWAHERAQLKYIIQNRGH
jgi:hypothetical protein